MIDPKKPLGTNYVLSEADREKFLALWQQYSHLLPRPKPDRGHFPDHEEHQSPEVYAAQTPIGGIPARSGVVPGSAECVIYQLVTTNLTEVTGFFQTVYNLSTEAIDADSFVVLARDKYGNWYITGGIDSGGGRAKWVESLSEGYSVLVQSLMDIGGGLVSDGSSPFQAVVPGGAYLRDPAREGGIYIALKARGSGDQDTGTGTGTGSGLFSGWYLETGPMTTCVEVVGEGSKASMDCITGDITFTNTQTIRVIANPSCPPPDDSTGTP
jgi:hypothetical protein